MKKLQLLRVGQSDKGTFGVLRIGQLPFAVTLEEPWRDNQRNISSIPVGQYICKLVLSPRFRLTYEVTGVPNRTHILFHTGNTLDATEGCILVGEEFSGVSIASSKRGYSEFMRLLDGDKEFELEIKEVWQ